ncbi:MAG: nucleotide exchange factor GrpE [Legionellaceae bacterium]|nr:nucleotide exchange factor GrpE [Legionellaceae bacterium]
MTDKQQKDWAKFKEELDRQEHEEENPKEQQTEGVEASAESPASALEHPDYQELAEKLSLAEQQAHENWEKSVRAVAELENVRRRAERDVANAHRYGAEKIIKNLLPVLDSLEQALQLAEKEAQTAMGEGLQLTRKIFLDALERENVQELNPMGEPFNPEQHEAMTTQEADDVKPNTVVAVFQKGYVLHDRVIRPARVVVSKAKSSDGNA